MEFPGSCLHVSVANELIPTRCVDSSVAGIEGLPPGRQGLHPRGDRPPTPGETGLPPPGRQSLPPPGRQGLPPPGRQGLLPRGDTEVNRRACGSWRAVCVRADTGTQEAENNNFVQQSCASWKKIHIFFFCMFEELATQTLNPSLVRPLIPGGSVCNCRRCVYSSVPGRQVHPGTTDRRSILMQQTPCCLYWVVCGIRSPATGTKPSPWRGAILLCIVVLRMDQMFV